MLAALAVAVLVMGLWPKPFTDVSEASVRALLERRDRTGELGKVRALRDALIPANPFYAKKLTPSLRTARFENLKAYKTAVPCTTRHDLVRDRLANPPYGTNLTFRVEAYVRCHQTSGTTTIPIRWLDTAESWNHIG